MFEITTNTLLTRSREWLEEDIEQEELDTLIHIYLSEPPRDVQHRVYIDCKREEGHARLYSNYFAAHPVYPPRIFEQRFGMTRELFLTICDRLQSYNAYWVQKPVCATHF